MMLKAKPAASAISITRPRPGIPGKHSLSLSSELQVECGTSPGGKLISGVQNGSITKAPAALALWLACAGCVQGPPKAPVIGEAFVGPALLKIRGDIPLQSSTIATLKHG